MKKPSPMDLVNLLQYTITLLQTLYPIKDFVWNKPKNLLIRTTQKFSFHLITPSEICKCLRKLRRKTAQGIDEFPQIYLKMQPTKFQNHCLSSSINAYRQVQFQTSWKISKVTPLYKSNSKSDFSSYCPISVLSCRSKVLEEVVHRHLSNYLGKHYLLRNSQFGFRPQRFTELACNLLVDDIPKNIDNGLLI